MVAVRTPNSCVDLVPVGSGTLDAERVSILMCRL
jgi:hypothetical protein